MQMRQLKHFWFLGARKKLKGDWKTWKTRKKIRKKPKLREQSRKIKGTVIPNIKISFGNCAISECIKIKNFTAKWIRDNLN